MVFWSLSSNESLDFFNETIESEEGSYSDDDTEEAEEKDACLFWDMEDRGDKGSIVKSTGNDNNSVKSLTFLLSLLLLLLLLLFMIDSLYTKKNLPPNGKNLYRFCKYKKKSTRGKKNGMQKKKFL